jgi:hypothetical protein
MNMKHHYVSSNGGEMYSSYVNGAIGRRADYICLDDPHKLEENMETTINYVRQSLFTRLNNPQKGRIVVSMQRLAPNDLSGVLLEGFDELPLQVDPELI